MRMFSITIALMAVQDIFVFGQTVVDMNTLKLMTNTFQATTAEYIKKQGVFLRTHWRNGCLDSGCCNIGFSQVYFNEDCPTWGWMKWSFNGPMMIAHKPFLSMCLECKNAQSDCSVGTARCTGSRSQQWHLGVHLDKTTSQGDILFSIHNQLFPDHCVTIDPTSESGAIILLRCGSPPSNRQLFYVNRDWFQTVITSQKLFSAGSATANITRGLIQ